MNSQAQVFATKPTFLYYTRYYAMLNKMDELRRTTTLANINKTVEDPLNKMDELRRTTTLANINKTV